MDIEEAKKFARNKIETDSLTQQVRDVIKITKWQKQDMREGFKETFKPLIKSQDSIKKSIDEQQNATIAQLQANQLALTQGLNQNRLAITEGFDKLDEVKTGIWLNYLVLRRLKSLKMMVFYPLHQRKDQKQQNLHLKTSIEI